MAPDHQIRTLVRNRTRTRRRSACLRHPNEPVTGFCALCLQDRLAGLDTSTDQLEHEHETIIAFPLSRRTRGHAGASSSGVVPELRRSKSVAVESCEVSNSDLRRKSCDVRASNRLSDLLDIDDTKTGRDGAVRVESKNIVISGIAKPVLEINENKKLSLLRNEISDNGETGGEEDLKTMKEHIDMEFQNRKKNFWEAASVYSQKLQKWRQKHREKKRTEVCNGGSGSDNNRSNFNKPDPQIQSELPVYELGRRSCDTEPRFSIDPHRMSMEEHRSSWDGYMIARTIPRLTPMLPTVDDLNFPPLNKRSNQQVQRIKEEGSSSVTSSSSITESSSSSMNSSSSKTSRFEADHMKYALNMVITESDLKHWHSSSIKNSNLKSASTTSRWRKMSNLWSHK